MTRYLRIFCTSLLLLAGQSHAADALKVFAAASLKESLDLIAAEWTRESDIRVSISFAASSVLARQIEAGAPADVFICADAEWMDYLQSRKLIAASTRIELVGNGLVLIAPAASQVPALALERSALRTALGSGRLAIGEVDSVPAGRYARQALITLGLWEEVVGQLAQAENVRAAMAFVARSEAPLGIVYATDARAEPRVRVLARFPVSSHERIVYPAASTAAGASKNAGSFLNYLKSPPARAIFEQAGFVVF